MIECVTSFFFLHEKVNRQTPRPLNEYEPSFPPLHIDTLPRAPHAAARHIGLGCP